MSDALKTISEKNAQIERLSHRDYDEAHKQMVETKWSDLPEESQDAIYFLLHHGETENEELRKHCLQDTLFTNAVQRARDQKLLTDTQSLNAGRSGVKYSWKVNPEFTSVLKDLTGKRQMRFFR